MITYDYTCVTVLDCNVTITLTQVESIHNETTTHHLPWQYIPPVQFTQSLSSLLCVVLENVPAGQLMGTSVPSGQ